MQETDMTKRALISDVAKTFDLLGWFAPSTIKAKILLQRVSESGIGWDDLLPPTIHESWLRWRFELHLLTERHIPRYYYAKCAEIDSAYAGVVYIHGQDKCGNVYISLVISNTKVALLERLTIPPLKLCGAKLLSQLHHTQQALGIPTENVFAWTDSTIVLSWFTESPH